MEIKEYWILMDKKEILAIFETLQECLCWKPSFPVEEPHIIRIKHLADGSFRQQVLQIAPSIFLG
jgi:hypothetical protein